MEEVKEEIMSADQQEVNKLAEQLKDLNSDTINSVFAGKRPEGMDYLVYKALRKTLNNKTRQYLKGNLFYNSGRGMQKVPAKEADLVKDEESGIKFVKATPYIKSKKLEE
jgi:fructose-1-phosphate kinase PfkB-like protein